MKLVLSHGRGMKDGIPVPTVLSQSGCTQATEYFLLLAFSSPFGTLHVDAAHTKAIEVTPADYRYIPGSIQLMEGRMTVVPWQQVRKQDEQ